MPGYSKIVAQSFGGPELLKLHQMPALPEPGEGEVRLRIEAAGVGYTDTIVRRGRYIAYTDGVPLTPGYDVVGTVDALGAGVSNVAIGDRVADMPVAGAYSQYMIRPAETLIPVPDNVDPTVAVEVPLMWMTAWQMLTRSVSLTKGDPILVVGAAGAVGRALVLLGRHLELNIVGTGSADNLAFIESLGATAIDYRRGDLPDAIRQASNGGVAAAFDAIGGKSWEASWQALRSGGTLVGYGFQDFIESEGKSADAAKAMHHFSVELNEAGAADGSLRNTVFYDIRIRRGSDPADYHKDATHLLKLIADGTVVPAPAEVLPLADAAEAHRRVALRGLRSRLVLRP